jgi:hypothetical protein
MALLVRVDAPWLALGNTRDHKHSGCLKRQILADFGHDQTPALIDVLLQVNQSGDVRVGWH